MTTLHDPQAPAQLPTGTDQEVSIPQFAICDESLRSAKIMIVDDEPINVIVAQKYLGMSGYENFISTNDSREAVALAYMNQPDLILLDLMMPAVSGLDILEALRADPHLARLPVIILTASNDQDLKRQALSLGANDFLNKPVDPIDLLPRVRNVLTVKQYQDHLREYSHRLETEVLRRTAELARSRQEVINCLARAAEFRDDHTGRHVFRVGRYTRIIASELGWTGDRLDMLEHAAQLHDIGKIGVPDSILLKPSKLTVEEFEIMQKHSDYGRQIMQSLPDHEGNTLAEHTSLGASILRSEDSPILSLASTIALSHHEKWDGSGYPLGLAGEDIPVEGRIVAVADVFDALSSKRPYKQAFPVDRCLQILEEGRGKHFDPGVIDAFFRRRADIIRTLMQHADPE